MKKSIIYTLLAAFVFFGCRKSDNPKLPEGLTSVPLPKITLDATSDKFINPGNPSLFKGKIIVDLYFAQDQPSKFDIIIKKTRGTTTKYKTLQADVTTFPISISLTGQQLIDLFAEPITGGDKFDIGADVTTKQGQKIEAFPEGASPYGSGFANFPGFSASVTFLTPCAFVASAYVGNFTVLQDDWADYKVGDVISIKMVSATQISFEYAVDPGTAKPIILTINPSDNSITVAKQVYGSYGGASYSAESIAGSASAVNPCDVSLSVRLTHTSAGQSPFNATIRLKKK